MQKPIRPRFLTGQPREKVAVAIRNMRKGEKQAMRTSGVYRSKPGKFQGSSGLAEYSQELGIRVDEEAKKIIQNKGRARVLDIGAGEGLMGVQLQKMFKRENVELHAIGLVRPFEKTTQRIFGSKLAKVCADPWNAFASYRVGDFAYVLPKIEKRFDLIVCTHVLITYRFAHVIANALEKQGRAFIQVHSDGTFSPDMMNLGNEFTTRVIKSKKLEGLGDNFYLTTIQIERK